MMKYLEDNLHVKVKGNWQLFQVDDRGVDFVGYRMYRDCTLLRKRMALRASRRLRKIKKKGKNMTYKDACTIMSYMGWIKHSNSYNFKSKYITTLGKLKKIRKVISIESKKQHNSTTDTN